MILGIFAIWLVWFIAERWVEAERWMWYLAVALLGIGWQLLDGVDHWWYGVGIGGGVVLLSLVADLLMVLADWARVSVLRQQGRRQ